MKRKDFEMEKIKELNVDELDDVTGGMGGTSWDQCNSCHRMTATHVLEKNGGICRSCNSENVFNNFS